MNKILVISILAIILLSVSFTSISALSPENELKLNDKIKSLEKKIKDLFAENTKLKNDIVKLKTENTKLKSENTKLKSENAQSKSQIKPQTTQKQSPSKLSSGYPSIDKRYSGIDAKEKIKELYNYHNSLTAPQRLVQISKSVPVSEFVLGIVYAGEWNVIYTVSGDRDGPDFGMESIDGKDITLIPFDCSHVPNYLQIILLTKIDETGKAYMIVFKNGVAVALDSTDKPYGMFGVGTQCDTGYDANYTYLKTLS